MNWEDFFKTPDFAGAAGAFLGFLNSPGETRLKQAFNLGAGFGCAVYLAPYLAERFTMESQTGRTAFSFVVGLVGMNIVPKVIDWAKASKLLALLNKRGSP